MTNSNSCLIIVNNILKEYVDNFPKYLSQGFEKLSEILPNITTTIRNCSSISWENEENKIQFNDKETNINLQILLQPTYNELKEAIKSLTESVDVKEQYIVYVGSHGAGYSSDWLLRDGIFSAKSILTILNETSTDTDENNTTELLPINILTPGNSAHWNKVLSTLKIKETKQDRVRVFSFPSEILVDGHSSVNEEIEAFSKILCENSQSVLLNNDILNCSQNIGTLQLTNKTGSFYIFDEACGQSSLLALNGFNLVIDAGYKRSPEFWNFLQRLDKIDTHIITSWNESNLFGLESLLDFKLRSSEDKDNISRPNLNYFILPTGPNPSKPKAQIESKSLLEINMEVEAHKTIQQIKSLDIPLTQMCRDAKLMGNPHQLYFKLGQGYLDAFPLWPYSSETSGDAKRYIDEWQKDSKVQSIYFDELVKDNASAFLFIWNGTKATVDSPSEDTNISTRILISSSCHESHLLKSLEEFSKINIICNTLSGKPLEKKLISKKLNSAESSKKASAPTSSSKEIPKSANDQKSGLAKKPADKPKDMGKGDTKMPEKKSSPITDKPLKGKITDSTKVSEKKVDIGSAKILPNEEKSKHSLTEQKPKETKLNKLGNAKSAEPTELSKTIKSKTPEVTDVKKPLKKPLPTDKTSETTEVKKPTKKPLTTEKPSESAEIKKTAKKPMANAKAPDTTESKKITKKPLVTDKISEPAEAKKITKKPLVTDKSSESAEAKKTAKKPVTNEKTPDVVAPKKGAKKPVTDKITEKPALNAKSTPLKSEKDIKKPNIGKSLQQKQSKPGQIESAVLKKDDAKIVADITINKIDLESDLEKVDVICQPSISLNTDDTLNNIDTSELLGKMEEIGSNSNNLEHERLLITTERFDLQSTPLSDMITESPEHPKTEEDVEALKTDALSIDQDLLMANEEFPEDEKESPSPNENIANEEMKNEKSMTDKVENDEEIENEADEFNEDSNLILENINLKQYGIYEDGEFDDENPSEQMEKHNLEINHQEPIEHKNYDTDKPSYNYKVENDQVELDQDIEKADIKTDYQGNNFDKDQHIDGIVLSDNGMSVIEKEEIPEHTEHDDIAADETCQEDIINEDNQKDIEAEPRIVDIVKEDESEDLEKDDAEIDKPNEIVVNESYREEVVNKDDEEIVETKPSLIDIANEDESEDLEKEDESEELEKEDSEIDRDDDNVHEIMQKDHQEIVETEPHVVINDSEDLEKENIESDRFDDNVADESYDDEVINKCNQEIVETEPSVIDVPNEVEFEDLEKEDVKIVDDETFEEDIIKKDYQEDIETQPHIDDVAKENESEELEKDDLEIDRDDNNVHDETYDEEIIQKDHQEFVETEPHDFGNDSEDFENENIESDRFDDNIADESYDDEVINKEIVETEPSVVDVAKEDESKDAEIDRLDCNAAEIVQKDHQDFLEKDEYADNITYDEEVLQDYQAKVEADVEKGEFEDLNKHEEEIYKPSTDDINGETFGEEHKDDEANFYSSEIEKKGHENDEHEPGELDDYNVAIDKLDDNITGDISDDEIVQKDHHGFVETEPIIHNIVQEDDEELKEYNAKINKPGDNISGDFYDDELIPKEQSAEFEDNNAEINKSGDTISDDIYDELIHKDHIESIEAEPHISNIVEEESEGLEEESEGLDEDNVQIDKPYDYEITHKDHQEFTETEPHISDIPKEQSAEFEDDNGEINKSGDNILGDTYEDEAIEKYHLEPDMSNIEKEESEEFEENVKTEGNQDFEKDIVEIDNNVPHESYDEDIQKDHHEIVNTQLHTVDDEFDDLQKDHQKIVEGELHMSDLKNIEAFGILETDPALIAGDVMDADVIKKDQSEIDETEDHLSDAQKNEEYEDSEEDNFKIDKPDTYVKAKTYDDEQIQEEYQQKDEIQSNQTYDQNFRQDETNRELLLNGHEEKDGAKSHLTNVKKEEESEYFEKDVEFIKTDHIDDSAYDEEVLQKDHTDISETDSQLRKFEKREADNDENIESDLEEPNRINYENVLHQTGHQEQIESNPNLINVDKEDLKDLETDEHVDSLDNDACDEKIIPMDHYSNVESQPHLRGDKDYESEHSERDVEFKDDNKDDVEVLQKSHDVETEQNEDSETDEVEFDKTDVEKNYDDVIHKDHLENLEEPHLSKDSDEHDQDIIPKYHQERSEHDIDESHQFDINEKHNIHEKDLNEFQPSSHYQPVDHERFSNDNMKDMEKSQLESDDENVPGETEHEQDESLNMPSLMHDDKLNYNDDLSKESYGASSQVDFMYSENHQEIEKYLPDSESNDSDLSADIVKDHSTDTVKESEQPNILQQIPVLDDIMEDASPSSPPPHEIPDSNITNLESTMLHYPTGEPFDLETPKENQYVHSEPYADFDPTHINSTPDILRGLGHYLSEPTEVEVEQTIEDEEIINYETTHIIDSNKDLSPHSPTIDTERIIDLEETERFGSNKEAVNLRHSPIESAASVPDIDQPVEDQDSDNHINNLSCKIDRDNLTGYTNGNNYGEHHMDSSPASHWTDPLGIPMPTLITTKPATKPSAPIKASPPVKASLPAKASPAAKPSSANKISDKNASPTAAKLKSAQTPPSKVNGTSNNVSAAHKVINSPKSTSSPKDSVSTKPSAPKSAPLSKTSTPKQTKKTEVVDHTKFPAFYMEIAYIPVDHDGNVNPLRVTEAFFTRIRARQYVLPGLEHNTQILDSMLAARKNWPEDGNEMEVRLIPVKMTETLKKWAGKHAQELSSVNIKVGPAVEHCSVSLGGDNSVPCIAHRIDF